MNARIGQELRPRFGERSFLFLSFFLFTLSTYRRCETLLCLLDVPLLVALWKSIAGIYMSV